MAVLRKVSPTAFCTASVALTSLSRRWLRDLTQPAYDAAIEAAVVIQREAFSTGEPQAAAQAFVAKRKAKPTGGPTAR